MRTGSMVATGKPGSAEHDVGIVLHVQGDTANVRWFRAATAYVESVDVLRERDAFGQSFQITIDDYVVGNPGGYFHSELYRGGALQATGLGQTRAEAIADVARQYRIKRARRWSRYA